MSTVFASQVDGWNDDESYGFTQIRTSPIRDGDFEGKDGDPSHYISVDDNREISFAQRKYEEYEKSNLNKNIGFVHECMAAGIVLPSVGFVKCAVGKLKKIANNQQ